MRTGRPTTEKKDKVLKVRISENLYSRIEISANKKGISVSEVVREALKPYLQK